MLNKCDYQYMKYQAVRASGSLDIIDDLIDEELDAKRQGKEVDYVDKIQSLQRFCESEKQKSGITGSMR